MEGEELWRQVALRMWGRLMGDGSGSTGGGGRRPCYDSTAVGLGVAGMSFRDAVRSMVGTECFGRMRLSVCMT